MEKINVTQAARQFSELLNRVAYQGAAFELERGGKPVARLVPVMPPSRITVALLNEFFAGLPSLDDDDGEAFLQDLQSVRKALPKADDPWGQYWIPMY
jgi:antitoxin (DNA-binding transcriptional repressor) of toxin-antitoxin stability system